MARARPRLGWLVTVRVETRQPRTHGTQVPAHLTRRPTCESPARHTQAHGTHVPGTARQDRPVRVENSTYANSRHARTPAPPVRTDRASRQLPHTGAASRRSVAPSRLGRSLAASGEQRRPPAEEPMTVTRADGAHWPNTTRQLRPAERTVLHVRPPRVKSRWPAPTPTDGNAAPTRAPRDPHAKPTRTRHADPYQPQGQRPQRPGPLNHQRGDRRGRPAG